VKYTISRKADKKVEQDLKIIKEIIIKRINPISIILFGGFGRGEGSFEIIKDKVVPLNDYDLYVVTDKKISDEKLEQLGMECSKAIGKGGLEFAEHPTERYDKNKFFHVDLRCLEYKSLGRLFPTQRTAELKNSMVIYGEDVRRKIPVVEVPVSEAIRLLFNKMHHLLLTKDNDMDFKLIHVSKVFMDCCTALLIYRKKFKPSYVERNKIFQKMDFPLEFKKMVNWATEFKLKPKFNLGKQEIEKLWENAVYWVGYSFKYIIKNFLNITSDEWDDIAKAIYRKLPYCYFTPYLKSRYLFFLQYYLTLRFFLKGFSKNEFFWPVLFSWRDAGIKVAIPVILCLFNKPEEAEKYLKKVTLRTKPLKERILKVYSIYYTQKLI
jgi:predicted nucleotidyltransferase